MCFVHIHQIESITEGLNFLQFSCFLGLSDQKSQQLFLKVCQSKQFDSEFSVNSNWIGVIKETVGLILQSAARINQHLSFLLHQRHIFIFKT